MVLRASHKNLQIVRELSRKWQPAQRKKSSARKGLLALSFQKNGLKGQKLVSKIRFEKIKVQVKQPAYFTSITRDSYN